MHFTKEQQLVLDHITKLRETKQDEVLLINAVAGAGKTFLLTQIAVQNPHSSAIYLAYNKSVAVEAAQKFPKSVSCSTIHALAYRAVVKQLGFKVGSFSYKDINASISYDHKLWIVECIKEFCLSRYTNFDEFSKELDCPTHVISLCKAYLEKMYKGEIECSHDFYLKVFHMGLVSEDIRYPKQDFLFIDESGDVTEVALEIFKLLPSQVKIAVGDNCVSGDMKVNTSLGWKKLRTVIKSLENKEEVLVQTYDKNTNSFKYLPASNPSRKGVKDVVKVKCSNTTLILTPNHKVLTVEGYKRADELTTSDLLVKTSNEAKSKYAFIPNPDQYQVILGSFFGDGTIGKTSKGNIYRLTMSHSAQQLGYLQWKASAFDVESDAFSMTVGGERNIKGTGCTVQDAYRCSTKSFGLQEKPNVQDCFKLDPLGLAVWLMDDGSIKSKNRRTNEILGITISTCAFSYQEHLSFQEMFKKNFDLDVRIGKDRKYYCLEFNKENSHKLLDIVNPYLHNNFTGKFKKEDTVELVLSSKVSEAAVDSVLSVTPYGKEEVFDITVEGTNNFVVSKGGQKKSHTGVVIHNCQNIYAFNYTINAFEIMKDSARFFNLTESFRVDKKIAKRIETFCTTYIDKDMKFVGTEIEDQSIVTRAFLTRTNAGLINTLLELRDQGMDFNLVRRPAEIFKVPLMLCFLKYQGNITDPSYRHLQVCVDDWYETPELQQNHRSPLAYITSLYEFDTALVGAARLLISKGKQAILDIYDYAKSCENKKSNLWVATAHSVKG